MRELGSVAGLVSVCGLVVLAVLYLRYARAVRHLRQWAGHAPERARGKRDAAPRRPRAASRRRVVRRTRIVALTGLAAAAGFVVVVLTRGAGSAARHHVARRPTPAQVARVIVLNASGVPERARRAAARLEADGFRVLRVGDAPAQALNTIVLAERDDRRAGTRAARVLHLRVPVGPLTGRYHGRRVDVLVELGQTV